MKNREILNFAESNDFLEIFDPETYIKYIKLKPDNQNFIKIASLIYIQCRQRDKYIIKEQEII